MPYGARYDAWTPSGHRPGSDLDFLREQLLDLWDIEYSILNCLTPVCEMPNLEYAAAFARAVNDWQIDEWLDPEPRLRASMIVACDDGKLASQEIDRLAGDSRFVQILLLTRTMEPLGRRKYWQMYETAVRHDLPIGIHFTGVGVGPITAVGKPSHYIEDHAGMTQAFQTQVTSLVCEGVFEHFPTLKVILIEGGFAWLPPLMWRLDRAWKKLRDEVPYLKRLPSEYIREHFWMTTQPIEEPPKPEYFQQLLEHINADEKLMFATDYPHWDFDCPDHTLPTNLPPGLKRKIMAENARAFYQL
jgi:predicted TIM-barrel fold metal-dependent hydrolase